MELISTGSPKKRFEKAKKLDPKYAVVINDNFVVKEGQVNIRLRQIRGQLQDGFIADDTNLAAMLSAILAKRCEAPSAEELSSGAEILLWMNSV